MNIETLSYLNHAKHRYLKMSNNITLSDGTVYSKRNNFCPISGHSLQAYEPFVGKAKIEKLQSISQRLKGLKILELNSTAQGGGVAEMLYSSVPFLNMLGIDTEWKIIRGSKRYYECTKKLHNLLQGKKGSFTAKMRQIYYEQLQKCVSENIIDYSPNILMINDPQPMLLCQYLRKNSERWIWRCHIDIEPAIRSKNGLLDTINEWIRDYDAAIFSAAHYIFQPWPVAKFVIPPFIDPLSEKNRQLTKAEINKVLVKYKIEPTIPIIAQIGRFDPWKGLDRTILTYRQVRKERNCQLIIAGGSATDDPESERILEDIYSMTKKDEGIHVLNLPLDDRLKNYYDVNAIQHAANIIMQPSTREGFGLSITEALWKGKPVIASNAGGIPSQIRESNTGFFYQNPRITAKKIVYLLDNPRIAEQIGTKSKIFVKNRFLIVDRITDYLMAIDMTINSSADRRRFFKNTTSFYPHNN